MFSTDVDIMYSSSFVMLSQFKKKKKAYKWSEQTLSVPKEAEYVSSINQRNLEEVTVL